MKKAYELNICGRNLNVFSDEGEGYVALVEKQLNDIISEQLNKGLFFEKAVMFACVEFCDKLNKALKDTEYKNAKPAVFKDENMFLDYTRQISFL